MGSIGVGWIPGEKGVLEPRTNHQVCGLWELRQVPDVIPMPMAESIVINSQLELEELARRPAPEFWIYEPPHNSINTANSHIVLL